MTPTPSAGPARPLARRLPSPPPPRRAPQPALAALLPLLLALLGALALFAGGLAPDLWMLTR